jgi:hypothetical protein
MAVSFLTSSVKHVRKMLGGIRYRVTTGTRCRYLSTKSFCVGFFCRRRRIVLSRKADWELTIRQGIDLWKYDLCFREFDRCESLSGATIIPLTLRDAAVLNASTESYRTQNVWYVPSDAVIELFDDKPAFNQWMSNNGYDSLIPRTVPLGHVLPFPYVIKKRRDAFGIHSFVVTTDSKRKSLGITDEEEYFCQEYVTGQHEYTTHVLMKNQRIVFSITIEFTFGSEFFVKGVQDKHVSHRVVDCPFLPLFEEILAKSAFSGICCFNFKLRDGKPVLFEINPRFGASLCPYVSEVLVHYI